MPYLWGGSLDYISSSPQSIRDIKFYSIMQQKLDVELLLHERAWTSLKSTCSSLRLILHRRVSPDPHHKYLTMRRRHIVSKSRVGIAQLVIFLLAKLTHSGSNSRFGMTLYLQLIILSTVSDVLVDSETLLMIDFMNLKIKSTWYQS
jgi:hypothetical protein